MYEEKGMHPRQKIRYIKAGGVVGFILLVLFFLIPGERQQVGDFVGSTLAREDLYDNWANWNSRSHTSIV